MSYVRQTNLQLPDEIMYPLLQASAGTDGRVDSSQVAL